MHLAPAAASSTVDWAWRVLRAARALAEELEAGAVARTFDVNAHGVLEPCADGRHGAVLAWRPGAGWHSHLPPEDARSGLLDLYLPICGATTARPITVGHLGQSLDGFIATHSGDSQFVTGEHNLEHLHRMRALCDAVVVGAGTVAADDPQLTVRRVEGPNPLRVVFDPGRRLEASYQVFTDEGTPTVYLCSRALVRPGERRIGAATIVGLPTDDPGAGVVEVIAFLRTRGCTRVFVEGGGVTVSAFVEANLLDRLQIAIAPVLIGDGRPAIRLTPRDRLQDCRRPQYRVFRMGSDVIFDCDLHGQADDDRSGPRDAAHIYQVI
jgi:riboflavin-specific deaminase-like protein